MKRMPLYQLLLNCKKKLCIILESNRECSKSLFIMNCIGGVMLCVLVLSVVDRGIEAIIIKLVFVSSLLSTQHSGVRAKTVRLGIRIWCLTPLSTIFQLHHGGQLYWFKYLETTTDLPRIMCQSRVTYIFLQYKKSN
jgi:hypothetical protein